ncbi:helix-turn-helix domain-containing protein [Streptomyces brasiliscabiei]|uniref:Helix-turn-helix domain-containing protein n=1 Tax=Streptomyces brasiliscabiei TaxID=2736302 RepID=A0ABU8G9Z4_9ACTN
MRGRKVPDETRAAIRKLLHAGLADRAIAHQTGTHHVTVARERKALGLPRHPPGRKSYPTLADAFHAHTEPADGGHLRWTGGRSSTGVPRLTHQGREYTASRIAFTLRTGREPVGQARPSCEFAECVAPACIADKAERDRDSAAYAGIFGGDA